MPPPLDLVQDSKLDTSFPTVGLTVHTFVEPSGSRRRAVREEHWKRERRLGRGGYGQVFLERCISGERGVALRALKVIDKHESRFAHFNRELEAIAKFSHQRVSLSIPGRDCFPLD